MAKVSKKKEISKKMLGKNGNYCKYFPEKCLAVSEILRTFAEKTKRHDYNHHKRH
jgi:hypothetical protein